MKIKILLLFFIVSKLLTAQVVGKVTDIKGTPLPYVNIYIENTYLGTTTNEDGNYAIETNLNTEQTLVFQFLGFKTLKKKVTPTQNPYILNIRLQTETTSLETVVVSTQENPANRIIREAIKYRKVNLAKTKKFTADFYSRGLWRIANAPKQILGQKIGDFNGGLDSTRSGLIYLSETISKIAYQAPDNFQEKIIASKVSGNDNGFSLNSARESNISFYQNTIRLNSEIVSPIADYAFNYYEYTLEGVFFDDRGNLINKIEVQPKRKKDRVFSGYIYIIEDDWEIFGIDLTTTGEAVQIPPIENLIFKQNFTYSEKDKLWVRISQTLDFSFAFFGVSGNGRFTAVYSNYDFNPDFDKNHFTKEILSFSKAANEKDSLYWTGIRPVPLTDEELNDYIKKDSVQQVRTSQKYLDSIDRVTNRPSLLNPLLGYSYDNSFQDWKIDISAPLLGTHFNTIQGWNIGVETSFQKNKKDSRNTFWKLYTTTKYGFGDDRLRGTFGYQQRFNNFSKAMLTITGGIKVQQFNASEPISPLINDITTTLFERNYIKVYERKFAEASYAEEIFNGFRVHGTLSYERRTPLFNNTDQVIIPYEDKAYTSNNPLLPENFMDAPFIEHTIVKANVSTRINFGQEYLSYPDGKFNLGNDTYPTLFLTYEKGFGASEKNYNFDQIKARLLQSFATGNKGRFGYHIKAGYFFNANDIAFIDYHHVNGNQTRIGTTSNYLNTFNLSPYYSNSTNTEYLEAHVEHDFKGWILGKFPLLNKLNWNLVLGAHLLSTPAIKPYTEYSIGIDNLGVGKFKLLRLDYVISNQNNMQEGAFIFGLKFLNLLD
ncbi:DUF5686 and carboxypeptidase regulatory-like domain-containing protein [Aquimarina intermedia]|nr:DUF5686 and carboxypeptidase regulatory-like domain-containing protein [Aquimarina intermedia]